MTNTNEIHQVKAISNNLALWAELFFIFLPFFVAAITLFYKNEPEIIIYNAEWSLAAALLSGQTIVKFITGLLKSDKKITNLGLVALVISLLIVFLLAPSLIILCLLLISEAPPLWLAICQIVLFAMSILSFLFLGSVSERIALNNNSNG